MNTDSWISQIMFKRRQKQKEKMQEKFSFLLEELKEIENRINKQFVDERESLHLVKQELNQILPLLIESEKAINNNLCELNSIWQESYNQIQILIHDLKTQCISNNGVTKELLFSIVAKIENTEECIVEAQRNIEAILQNKSETVTYSIAEVKSLLQLLAVNDLLDEIYVEEVRK